LTRLRKAARATVFVQIFNWAGLLLSLITVPLYLAWLGDERYGLLLTGLAFAGYLMFSDAGLSWASMLLIAQASGRSDPQAVAAIVRTSFPLAAISSLLVAGAVGAAYFAIGSGIGVAWLPVHPEFPGLLLAIGGSVIVTLTTSPFYNLLIGLQDAHLAALYQGGTRILGTLSAVAIASTGSPLGLVYSGNIAAAILMGLLAANHCRIRHRSAFQRGPLWEINQVRQQLRTGAKSFVMQIGIVLSGTAPVLAISIGAGAQFVPLYSIPYTLITAPLSILATFSATLQPAFGEAIGQGEYRWIAGTVSMVLKRTILLLGLIMSGFVLLAEPFITWWTAGKLLVSDEMVISVLAIASLSAILTVFRYALTGINRHRTAALADLLAGILALGLGLLVVTRFGPGWIGLAIVGTALATTAWILPRELFRSLNGERAIVGFGFWFRISFAAASALLAGWVSLRFLPFPDGLLLILPAAGVITVTFAALASLLVPGEFRSVKETIIASVRAPGGSPPAEP
jgi:O-antigen/teichoic acid export membrane protein